MCLCVCALIPGYLYFFAVGRPSADRVSRRLAAKRPEGRVAAVDRCAFEACGPTARSATQERRRLAPAPVETPDLPNRCQDARGSMARVGLLAVQSWISLRLERLGNACCVSASSLRGKVNLPDADIR